MSSGYCNDVLLKAFDESRVAALHVDLQSQYFCAGSEPAFTAVNALAHEFREASVTNYWAALTGSWQVSAAVNFGERYLPSSLKFHELVQPAAEEAVFEKAEQSLFGPMGMKAECLIKIENVDTLLIDGVIYDRCVADTAIGAVEHGFSSIVIMDATDCRSHDPDSYRASMLKRLDPGLHGRLGVATQQQVRDAIAASRIKASGPISVLS